MLAFRGAYLVKPFRQHCEAIPVKTFGRLAIVVLVAFPTLANAQDVEQYELVQKQMGTLARVICESDDKALASRGLKAAQARISELNGILSDYDPESELSRLSAAAPTKSPVTVSEDLMRVLVLSEQLSRRSQSTLR